MATAKELWKNDHWARHVSVSPDGKILASDTSQDGSVRLWDAESGAAIAKLDTGKRSWSRQVAFSPDGNLVGYGTYDAVQIWDVKTEKLLRSFVGAGPDFAFAPDSASVFTFGPILEKWDVKTGASLYPDARAAGHVGAVANLAFSPDGRFLASTDFDDHTLRVWNRTTGEHKLHKAPYGFPLTYTPDGRLLVPSRGKGGIELIESETGKEIRRFAFPIIENVVPRPNTVRVSQDGKTLLALGQTPDSLGSRIEFERMAHLSAWDIATGKVLLEKTIPDKTRDGGAFSPSGRYLARLGMDDLLDIRTGRRLPLTPKPYSYHRSSVFSPDGRLLATHETSNEENYNESKALSIHEVLTGRQILRLESRDFQSVAFSPDGRLLAATDRDALHVFEIPSGKRLLHLPAKGRLTNWNGRQFATCLAFAPDGRAVATGHADGTILLWDMAPAWKAIIPPKGSVDPSACWKDLADPDPKIAWASIERLTSDPVAAVRLVGTNVKPVVLDARWVAARIAELSSADFKTRESATKELKTIAEAAKPLFEAARKAATTAEGQQRLDELIDYSPAVPSDDAIRAVRALAVLEHLGTKEAIEVLDELAGGAVAAELTREAKAALERLRKR